MVRRCIDLPFKAFYCELKQKFASVSHLIMELFQEGEFILERLHLPLQIHSSKSGVIHVLHDINNIIWHSSTTVLSTDAQQAHSEEVFVF